MPSVSNERIVSTFDRSTHEGSTFDPDTLRDAGIEHADALVATTGSDNVNAVAVHIARQAFGVPTAVARLNDPYREETYRVLGIAFVADAAECSDAIHESLFAIGAHSRPA